MRISHVWILLGKELTCALRDRNAMLAFLLTPLLSPAIYGLIFTLLAARVHSEQTLVLPIEGAGNAPELVQWLTRQTGVEVVASPADPAGAVRDSGRPGVLSIGPDFQDQLARGRPAVLTLVSDGSRGDSQRFAARVRELVLGYGAQMAQARLTLRGIDPTVVAPMKLDEWDVSGARERDGGVLAFLPMLLVWMALMGGMPLALDSTAGERERGSLEPLLLNPVASSSVIGGKWLATAAQSALGLMLAAASSILMLRFVPWHEVGVQMHVSDLALWSSTLVMLPVALLVSAAAMLVSALARSFQQAQSYAGLLMLAVLLPCILTVALPGSHAPWMSAVPVVGQMSITRDVLGGQAAELPRLLRAMAGTIIPALVLVVAAARLMRREAIVFRSD
jgi:sodium transport system permease protein